MKHRTLMTITIVLALLVAAIPASTASTTLDAPNSSRNADFRRR